MVGCIYRRWEKNNAGVVIFETDRIFGGDSWYYYTGTFEAKNGKLTARLKSTHYAGPIGSPSLGGRPEGVYEFEVVGSGKDNEGRRTLRAHGRVIDPALNVPVFAELTWRASLP